MALKILCLMKFLLEAGISNNLYTYSIFRQSPAHKLGFLFLSFGITNEGIDYFEDVLTIFVRQGSDVLDSFQGDWI
jgi:hypothetical protein